MKTNYENEEFFVCESLDEFSGKLLDYKKAILLSNLELFKSQVTKIFKIINDQFGPDSEELRKSSNPRLFCGNCGVAYTQAFLLRLTLYDNENNPKIEGCPKCGSKKLSVIYKL
jgi:hypothetical protein